MGPNPSGFFYAIGTIGIKIGFELVEVNWIRLWTQMKEVEAENRYTQKGSNTLISPLPQMHCIPLKSNSTRDEDHFWFSP